MSILRVMVHSLVVAVVVESLISIWKFQRPSQIIRFRFLILVLPVLALPLYRLAYSGWGSPQFRERVAIFDGGQWLVLPVGGLFPAWYLLLLVAGTTTIFFLWQELLPMVRRGAHGSVRPYNEGELPKLDVALNELSLVHNHGLPPLFLVEAREPAVWLKGTFNHTLMVSRAMVDLLDPEELQGVLGHEVAHITRRDNWLSWVLLLFRTLMFYNPVALVTFRRVLLEGEKVCDEMAVKMTKKPMAFAASLIKVFRAGEEVGKVSARPRRFSRWFVSLADNLASHSRRVHVEERVERLVHQSFTPVPPFEKLRIGLTAAGLMVLLFFIA